VSLADWLPNKEIFTDLHSLATRVVECSASVVTIDGGSGAGKTTLARSLSNHLNWFSHDLDENLPGNDAPYVGQVDYIALAAALQKRPLIISGICIRQICESMDFHPDISIYVVRQTLVGLPGDLYLFDAEARGYVEPLPRSSVDNQVQVYHRDYKPIEQATFVYSRTEQ